MSREMTTTDELFQHAVDCATAAGLLETGDLVVITAGVPVGISGTTNLLKVHVVGDVLVKGKGLSDKNVTAPLCVAHDNDEALKNFVNGNILVIKETNNEILSLLKSASGIITEKGGTDSHAAIVGLALDIPVIIGAENATGILRSGTVVTMNSSKGLVSAAADKIM